MALLPRPVMMMIWSQPAARASSTPYWMMGLSTSGSISLGWALVAGKKRVPSPAAGKTALRTFMVMGCRRWPLVVRRWPRAGCFIVTGWDFRCAYGFSRRDRCKRATAAQARGGTEVTLPHSERAPRLLLWASTSHLRPTQERSPILIRGSSPRRISARSGLDRMRQDLEAQLSRRPLRDGLLASFN